MYNSILSRSLRRDLWRRKLSLSGTYTYLIDPFYYGYFIWNNILHEGKHKPLISKETYELNQRILKKGVRPRFRIHTYALKGIVKCGECKKIVTWYEKKGKVYGECNTKDKRKDLCNQKKCGREDLYMKEIVEMLKTFQIYDKRLIEAIREELMKENESQYERERLTLANAESRIMSIRSALNTAYEDRLSGLIEMSKYQEIEKKYNDEQKGLEDTVKKIKKYSDKQKEIGLAIFDLSQNGEKIFQKATDEDKRSLLNIMFKNVYLLDGRMKYEINPAFTIMRNKALQTNNILLKSSGVVEIRDVNTEKPELGRNAVVTNEVMYADLTNSIIRNGWGSNPQPSQ